MILALALSAFVFAVLAFVASAWALVQVEGFKRSTHQVALVDPSKQEFENMTEEVKQVLTQEPAEFDNIM